MLAKHRTVLCVDDDPDDQMMVLDTIREIDPAIRVASALNGVEALRFLEEGKSNSGLPCLVLMDINMPLMDGKQAVARIRKDRSLDAVTVVMFTTSASKLDQAYCERIGVPFVTKPMSHKALEQIIRKLLSLCPGAPAA